MAFKDFLQNLPEVISPTEKKVNFKVAIKWTLIVLLLYFVLCNIPLYGITENALSNFEYLAILLGTSFGSIITLGIGPIVMASIILQLLVGAQILKIDTNTEDGKKFYQGLSKLLSFVFIIFEAMIYVLMGGVAAVPGKEFIVIIQLCIGGVLLLFMDEIVQKWGLGSGISLFIVGGIAWRLFAQLFQFIGTSGQFAASGKVLSVIYSFANNDPTGAMVALVPIVITVLLFFVVVFAQSLKVEIPLSYDRVRGYNVKWPLSFFYTGVIPVILVSSLTATLQLFGGLLQTWLGHPTFLGNFVNGVATSGFAFWIGSTDIVSALITGTFRWQYLVQSLCHLLFYCGFSVLFSFFWVTTSGLDANSQAKKIMGSGMSIPGFRKDERVLESILSRYVKPLTIMGGFAIGLLASVADLFGSLVAGTAILLAIMILYQMYQNVAQKYALDMNPAMKNFFGGVM